MWKESVSGMVAVLCQHMPGGTEEKKEKSQAGHCPGRDSNRTRLESKSEALLLEPSCSVNIDNIFPSFSFIRIWTKLVTQVCLFRNTYGTHQVLSSKISFNISP
jgi:hypothetical protein